MICDKCNEDGILNQANGNYFYYCKNCKIEINLTIKSEEAVNTITLDDGAGTVQDLDKTELERLMSDYDYTFLLDLCGNIGHISEK